MYSEYTLSVKSTKAEELFKTYKILLSDLIVDNTEERFFDGVDHFIHTKTGKKYSYDSFENNWYKES
jgi:hypothetical protein